MKTVCEQFKSTITDFSVKQQIENLMAKERRNEIVIQAYQESDTKRKNLEGNHIAPFAKHNILNERKDTTWSAKI